PGKEGDGAILLLSKGQATPFATGLDDPRGLAAYQEWLFVVERQRVLRVGRTGKAEVYAAATAFPDPPHSLHDVAVDPESGTVYVSDTGDAQGQGGAVYRINPKRKVDLVTDRKRLPALQTPAGLTLDGASHLLVADAGAEVLYR